MNWYIKFQKYASFRYKVLMLAKRISTQLFDEIISKFENKELKPIQQIVIDRNKEKELIDFNIGKIVVEIGELNDVRYTMGIKGNFIQDWRDIKLNIDINFNYFSNKQYEFFMTETTNALEHEIEHAANTKRNPGISASVAGLDEPGNSLAECIYKTRNYFLNESEMNAYIREFMTRAKYHGAVLEDLIAELIRNSILKCNPVEINNHLAQKTEIGTEIEKIIKQINDKYQSRINQLYPNRKSWLK